MLINKDWLFYRQSEPNNKIKVDLPYDAMLREARDISFKGGDKVSFFKGDDYIYEKMIKIDDLNHEIYFEFEGIYHHPQIYINDVLAYERQYGYSTCLFNATKFLKRGDNLLKVVATNSDQPNSRWYSGAGIYRNVHMYVLPKTHIRPRSFKINTLDYKEGKISFKCLLSATTDLKIEILDQSHKSILNKEYKNTKEIDDVLIINQPNLWNAEHPYLYKAVISIKDQKEELKFGIRQIELDKDQGLLINGERTVLFGACIHSDNALLGAESYKEVEYRKVRQLKELGYNAIRSAHNPICKDFLEAADELGLYVMDEYVDCWYIHKTKFGYSNYMETNYEDDLLDMVEKDYSHPSVIFYSTGNEVSETAEPRGIELQEKMNKYLHFLDNSRLTTCGINVFFNGIVHTPLATYSDKKAEDEYHAKPKVEGSSDIFNTLANIVGANFMKKGAKLHIVDKNTRGAFAHMDVAGYNYGILRYKKDIKKYPNRFICGTETFVSDAALFYEQAKKYPRVIGDFVWAGLDYLGEAGFSAELNQVEFPFLKDRSGWLTDDGGRKDILGDTTSEGDYTLVAFRKKVIDIGVVSPYDLRCKCKKAAWRFNHAMRSYSFPGEEGNKCTFYIYSHAPRVELYQNDKLIKKAKIKPEKCFVKFNGKYFSGRLKAVAKDEEGNVLGESILKTASREIKLHYYKEDYPELKRFAYVHFSFGDDEGIVSPHRKHTIEINDVKGGKLIRLGNAASYNKIGYLTNKTPTYHEKAMAIFEYDEDSQDITFEVTSELGKEIIKINRKKIAEFKREYLKL